MRNRALFAAGLLAATAILADRSAVAQQRALPRERTANTKRLEVVHTFRGHMPVGIAVNSRGRRFVSYPRWGDPVPFTLAELRGGREVPYPRGGAYQRGHERDPRQNIVSLQGILVDPEDRLWALDTSTVKMKPTSPFVPKLIGIDTRTTAVVKTIALPADVAPPGTYLNDLRVDLRRGSAGMAYITDSGKGPSGIIVVDLASGRAWRRLAGHRSVRAEPDFVGIVEGQALFRNPKNAPPTHVSIQADGIAIGADGERLYYTPLAGRRMYSVSVDALSDPDVADADVAATVVDLGDKGVTDGMEEDTANRIYTTNWEHNAILRRLPNGLFETVVHDPRLLWPDTLDLARDGYLYVIANQLHRQPDYHDGRDRRVKPYSLMRIRVDAKPVLLRK